MGIFNFKDVHTTMTALNWTWKYENGEIKVPPIEDLKSMAEFCLNRVADSEDETASSAFGGFEADKVEETLELRFIVDRANPLSPMLNHKATNELARKA